MFTRLHDLVSDLLARVRCLLTEHHDVYQTDRGRLYVLCLHCGRATQEIQTGKVAVPASVVNVDQARQTRRSDLARLQARWKLRERA